MSSIFSILKNSTSMYRKWKESCAETYVSIVGAIVAFRSAKVASAIAAFAEQKATIFMSSQPIRERSMLNGQSVENRL